MTIDEIDNKAIHLAQRFKKVETELLQVICLVDQQKIFRKLGYSSLFKYCVDRLQLSESQTCGFIAVARKSQTVPELKASIEKGDLTVSKAKRITSVIDKANSNRWIQLARTSSQKQLEKEVALAHPEKAIIAKMSYVADQNFQSEKVQVKQNCPRVKLELGLSEQAMLRLRRVQDLISQKKKRPVSLEESMDVLLDDYIKRKDPVKKAQRQVMKGQIKSDQKDEPSLEGSLRSEDIRLTKEISSPDNISSSPSRLPTEGASLSVATQSTEAFSPGVRTHNAPGSSAKGDISTQRSISNKRKALPAKLKHQVYLKAGGQCTAHEPNGQRCSARRFLEIHHIRPLSEGGSDQLENLTLLCSSHHAYEHGRGMETEKPHL